MQFEQKQMQELWNTSQLVPLAWQKVKRNKQLTLK